MKSLTILLPSFENILFIRAISPAPNLCPETIRTLVSGSSPIAKIIVVRLLADMQLYAPAVFYTVAKHAKKSKFRVIIAGAGGAAHLPGMIASFTNMPVIGVPIMVYNDKQGERHKFSAFGGLDSLVSMSEMPTGSPVACVGVNKAENAGIYAAKILANEFPDIAVKLVKFKNSRHDEVLEESEKMRKRGIKKFSN